MSFDSALTEHGEEFRVCQRLYRSQFELEEGRLMGVEIHAVDAFRFAEDIVQRVTASTGDHDDPITAVDVQRALVNVGIFPTLVVDKVMSVDLIEKPMLHTENYFRSRCSPLRAG